MRTSIDIDDALWDEIRSFTGIKMKKRVVETVFREYIRMKRRQALAALVGSFSEFDLDHDDLRKMRDDR